MKIRFEKRDCWIGLYWNKVSFGESGSYEVFFYLCLIPCIVITWTYVKFK